MTLIRLMTMISQLMLWAKPSRMGFMIPRRIQVQSLLVIVQIHPLLLLNVLKNGGINMG